MAVLSSPKQFTKFKYQISQLRLAKRPTAKDRTLYLPNICVNLHKGSLLSLYTTNRANNPQIITIVTLGKYRFFLLIDAIENSVFMGVHFYGNT